MEKTEMKFNLIDEPWIKVLLTGSKTEEVSLRDALVNAHMYRDLAGEMPTQDAAMLRLMLAVLHTVFSRVDENGEPSPLTRRNAAKRWEGLWKQGSFPAEAIEKYLAEWHERFWLFHPERPFFQVPEAAEGTAYGAPKLNGELSESGNKVRLFPKRSGSGKESLTYAEAARWLLNVVNYDDASLKKPSPTMGWLGKLGLILPTGNNLFETLMLNLIFLRDGTEEWGEQRPTWEINNPRTETDRAKCAIHIPDNPAELYTTQFRRVLLKEKDGYVTDFHDRSGDWFPDEEVLNGFAEQMTMWRKEKSKTGNDYKPKTLNPSVQIWREFGSIASKDESSRTPGSVIWTEKVSKIIGKDRMIRFKAIGMQYGNMNSSIDSVYSDSLSFHTALLGELGKSWRVAVNEQISRCDRIANIIGELRKDLLFASEIIDFKSKKQQEYIKQIVHNSMENYYYLLDTPFREWLVSINPMKCDISEKCDEWRAISKTLAIEYGKQLVETVGQPAYTGRLVKKKQEDKEGRYYSSPRAYNDFQDRLNQIDK